MDISVGILSATEIHFFLKGNFHTAQNPDIYNGTWKIFRQDQTVYIENSREKHAVQLPFLLTPVTPAESDFELADVTIGVDFHWERKENQRFKGCLKIIAENDQLTAVNILHIEDYLLSVISSEMSAMSAPELLKAHAVISRSWLLAQREKSENIRQNGQTTCSCHRTETEYIRWFDREDHRNFDVCADDHCQRYQGLQKITVPTVHNAIAATRGEVLTFGKKICDARFSKCCGGISENFENVWEPIEYPYLKSIYDGKNTPISTPDLTQEENIRQWIEKAPDVFCHTEDKKILADVLNDYDRETSDFFRWQVHYSREEISELIHKKLDIDFGLIEDLIPVERGISGRITRLKIIGTQKTLVIGKELLIRKALSTSHLYSSAFIVDKISAEGQLQGFLLKGAGWGHGVGLCQIGAAVMSCKGYSYREILHHYFPGATLKKIYE